MNPIIGALELLSSADKDDTAWALDTAEALPLLDYIANLPDLGSYDEVLDFNDPDYAHHPNGRRYGRYDTGL